VFYSITDRRLTHPEEFKADMAKLFELLRDGVIGPVVIDRLPLAAAREVLGSMPAGSAVRSCCYPGPRRRNGPGGCSKLSRPSTEVPQDSCTLPMLRRTEDSQPMSHLGLATE